MRIKLENFRCYENVEFDFGDTGMVLLSGASGSGKSTILNGIYFALYGEGRNVIMYEKKKCKVVIEEGVIATESYIKITRTKGPNRLVLETSDNIYEDQSAQHIINKKYGDMFDTTGYVAQNAVNSFIMMNPIDKLSFLEKFAFKDIDLSSIKARCKSVIKDRKETHIGVSSQYDMSNNVLKDMKEPEQVEFPIKISKSVEKTIQNEEIRYKNCGVLIKRAKKNIKALQEELSRIKLLESNIENKVESISVYQSKLDKLNIAKKGLSCQDILKIENRIKEYENILKIILNNKQYYDMKSKYDLDKLQLEKIKEQEISDIKTEISKIESTLWAEYNKEDIDENIKNTKECLVYILELSRLQEEQKLYSNVKGEDLEILQSKLEEQRSLYNSLKLQDKVYKCPSCETKLYFDTNNTLCLSHIVETPEQNLKKVRNNIIELERKIEMLKKYNDIQNKIDQLQNNPDNQFDITSLNPEEMKDDLEYMKKYKTEQLSLENRKSLLEKSLDTQKFSTTLLTLQKSVEKAEKTLKEIKLPKQDQPVENEEQVRLIIQKDKENREKLNSINQQIEVLVSDIEECKKSLEALRNTKGDVIVEDLIENISKGENELESLETDLSKHSINLQQIEKYKEYLSNKNTYEGWITKKNELERQEKEERLKYAAASNLLDKILEAESIAILTIINSINTHAQLYLDQFFTDNPISIKLLTFKESKKSVTKPQINLAIEYKGMECDTSTLSGGELARVVLAFTLALAEMFNTPLILLDECTASLDESLSTAIINAIRENFSNKLVIVISHQNISGIYDRTITI